MHFKLFTYYLMLLVILLANAPAKAQETTPNAAITTPPTTAMWLGTYGTVRLSKNLFWAGELHYRRAEFDDVPFVGRMDKLYNRHGITYLFSKKFSATLGGVLRFDFSENPKSDNYESFVMEPRIWHEYLFALPFPKFMVYHRIRLEHRWNRSTLKGSDWIFRNRWRYKFMMKIPLNNTKLVPGTFYFNPDIELIMQSGKSVINSPLEDLRIYPALAYIASSRITYSTGMMYTTGQKLGMGHVYSQKWVFKFNVYLNFDFRKFEAKIPEIKARD